MPPSSSSTLGLIAFIVALTPIFAFFFLRDSGAIVSYLIDRLRPVHIETTVACGARSTGSSAATFAASPSTRSSSARSLPWVSAVGARIRRCSARSRPW